MKWDNEKEFGLICPECECRMNYVIESKRIRNGVKRRRECRNCGYRWNTRERTKGKED